MMEKLKYFIDKKVFGALFTDLFKAIWLSITWFENCEIKYFDVELMDFIFQH